MAKLERRLKGNFDSILARIEHAVMEGSMTASKEGSADFRFSTGRCAVRVYERFSVLGSNRVSMNLTMLEADDKIMLSVITSGGSQAMFFKINTFGEESFLDTIKKIVKEYEI